MLIKISFILCSIFLLEQTYSQNWKGSEPDTLFDSNGKILSIENYSNDCKMVLTFDYNEEGKLSKTTFMTLKDQTQYEKVTTYFSNGNVAEEYFYFVRNRVFYGVTELDSTFTEYYESGAVRSKRNYLLGKEHGKSIIYYENGDISTELSFDKSKLMNAKSYDQNGNLLNNGSFQNGNGELISYDRGVKVGACKYKNGRLIKRTCICL